MYGEGDYESEAGDEDLTVEDELALHPAQEGFPVGVHGFERGLGLFEGGVNLVENMMYGIDDAHSLLLDYKKWNMLDLSAQ